MRKTHRVDGNAGVLGHAQKVLGYQSSRMAARFFARVPVVTTAARRAFDGALEPQLLRKGSKNYNWYYRALAQRETDAKKVALCVCRANFICIRWSCLVALWFIVWPA